MAWTAAPDGAGGLFLSGQTGGLLGAQGFGGRDIWVAHFDDTGAETWTWQLGTVFEDNVSASVVGRGGRLFLGGTTRGSLGGPSAGEYDAWVGRFDTSCTPGTSYCVTSLTSIPGCQAAIHGAGFPHLDDPDGYRISSGNVPGGALGICLFGDSGPASTPIGTLGGQICVQSPAFRCQPESGGGTPGVCDGELTFTLQDLIAVSPIVVTGATIHAQIWARDGANPDGFLLSDGLRFTVCP